MGTFAHQLPSSCSKVTPGRWVEGNPWSTHTHRCRAAPLGNPPNAVGKKQETAGAAATCVELAAALMNGWSKKWAEKYEAGQRVSCALSRCPLLLLVWARTQ